MTNCALCEKLLENSLLATSGDNVIHLVCEKTMKYRMDNGLCVYCGENPFINRGNSVWCETCDITPNLKGFPGPQ